MVGVVVVIGGVPVTAATNARPFLAHPIHILVRAAIAILEVLLLGRVVIVIVAWVASRFVPCIV